MTTDELPALIEQLDEMCLELQRGADPRRTMYLVLEMKESVVDVARALRGVEEDNHIVVRAMAEVILATVTHTMEAVQIAFREGASREEATEQLSVLVGRVGALTAQYRSRIGGPGGPTH